MLNFTCRQRELLDAALSYMYSNVDDANEIMDTDFNETEIDELREIIAKEELN